MCLDSNKSISNQNLSFCCFWCECQICLFLVVTIFHQIVTLTIHFSTKPKKKRVVCTQKRTNQMTNVCCDSVCFLVFWFVCLLWRKTKTKKLNSFSLFLLLFLFLFKCEDNFSSKTACPKQQNETNSNISKKNQRKVER